MTLSFFSRLYYLIICSILFTKSNIILYGILK